MMKALLLLLVAFVVGCTSLTTRSPAGDGGGEHDGPGTGGGTDLKRVPGKKDPVLIDYAKTWSEEPIDDPRAYKDIYTHVAPKLERLDYYFPGIKTLLEKVFEKEWRLTDEVFKPNHVGEIKPIKQTESDVKINRAQFASMSETDQQKAWLHEMVRAYVNEYTKIAVILSAKDLQNDPAFNAAIDQIVRTITPLIFDERPVRRLAQEWSSVLDDQYETKYQPKDPHVHQVDTGFMTGREDMYRSIATLQLQSRFQDLCVNQSPLPPVTRDSETRAETTLQSNVDFQINFDHKGALGRRHNVYWSPMLNAVGLFAARTISVIEGVAVAGYRVTDDLNLYSQNANVKLDTGLREQLRTYACTEAARTDLLQQAFREFDADRGQIRALPPARLQH